MSYLYHHVPPEMYGNILMPLNQLKHAYPKAYELQIKKYEGREYLLNDHVPILGCLWNDVIHLTPVHPSEVYKELRKYRPEMPASQYYQIDARGLPAKDTVLFLYEFDDREDKLAPKNFIPYDPASLSQYDTVPEATKRYFKDQHESGRRPLLFFRIPHVLYQGTLDVSDLEIIDV